MSKENYRRLGDYIREVDVRNRDLEVKELLGGQYLQRVYTIYSKYYRN